jgi:ATP-binding cassette subfamily C protein EexD
MKLKNKIKSDLEEALYLCRHSFISAGVFSLFINFLMLVPVVYMLQLYDRVIPSGSMATLIMLTLIAMLLFMTMGGLEWVRSQILVKVSARLENLLNERLYDISFKQSLYTGGQKASSQPLDDLTGLRQFLTGNGLFAFFDAPWIPIYIAVMFMFHFWIGVMAVLTACVLIVVAVTNEKLTRGALTEANTIAMANRARLNKNLVNAEVIESMGMLGNMRQRWKNNNEQILELQTSASSKAGMFTASSKVLRMAAQSLILGLGAYLAIEREISPGSMIAGSILLGRALAPIDQMIAGWKGFIAARGQYGRINELFSKIPEDEEKMSLPSPEGSLVAEAAFVVPPGAKVPVLKNINFEIPCGMAVGLIGPSGAGKSTLARAMQGIWPTSSGKIRLDGADVFAWDRQELGPSIGYLPQDVELFEGTVSENISRFGNLDSELVVKASKAADVHEMILRLPEGYDTPIGPAGGALSGGQRQRLGLARALYGDPVLIILDEPNSSLDDVGEAALTKAIEGIKQRQATVVVISHRPNILGVMDSLMILKDGQLVAFDKREKVLSQLKPQQTVRPINPGSVVPVSV